MHDVTPPEDIAGGERGVRCWGQCSGGECGNGLRTIPMGEVDVSLGAVGLPTSTAIVTTPSVVSGLP